MELKFNDLRRYAIDNRVEVQMTDRGSGRVVVINTRGQAQIRDDARDFRVEDVIAAADNFEVKSVEVKGANKPELYTREQMLAAMNQHFRTRGFAGVATEEED
jgi:hypothetical protein